MKRFVVRLICTPFGVACILTGFLVACATRQMPWVLLVAIAWQIGHWSRVWIAREDKMNEMRDWEADLRSRESRCRVTNNITGRYADRLLAERTRHLRSARDGDWL